MTTYDMLARLPGEQPDFEELQEIIGRELQGKLFARRVGVDEDPFSLSSYPHWECVCTACGKKFEADVKDKLKDMTVCPMCGAKVEPHRWTFRQGGKQTGAFLFYHLFRGADKQEMKIIPQLHAREIIWFHRLYQAGVIRADQDGVDWARARRSFYHDIPGGDEKQLYRYIHRQAERCERSCASVLHDYADYLSQIQRLGGGELWPHDLDEAHRRLSARERKIQDEGLNSMFRARRRLWQ